MKLLSKTNLWAGTQRSLALGLKLSSFRLRHSSPNQLIYTLLPLWLRTSYLAQTYASVRHFGLGPPTLDEGTGTSPRFGEGHFGFKLASGF